MFNPDIDFSEADKRDNLKADETISDATAVYTAPIIAWSALDEARWRLMKARTASAGIGPRFNPNKIDITSTLDYEAYYTEARHNYVSAIFTFRYCLQRAMELGLFTQFQAQLWREYREHEHIDEDATLQKIADAHNLPKSKVQYLVTSPKAISNFCLAVEDAMKDFAPQIAVR